MHTLDATFAALADPTRRAILARLTRGDASVTELAAPVPSNTPPNGSWTMRNSGPTTHSSRPAPLAVPGGKSP